MEQVAREQDIVDLRLGQRIQVDDGTCPAGQIKEVSGARMSPNGVERARTMHPAQEEIARDQRSDEIRRSARLRA